MCGASLCAHAQEPLLITEMAPSPVYSLASKTEALDSIVNKRTLADYIIEKASTYPSSIDISSFKIKYTDANFHALSSLIYYETPELFNVAKAGIAYYPGGDIAELRLTYRFSAKDYPKMLQDMKDVAEKLLTGVKGNDNLSDLEKLLILHDRLAVWTEYDVDFSTGEQMYTAYGVLVAREGVCMGYTLAYDYLLEQIGIDNYYCQSDSHNHAWNIVKLNEKWYHVDVTWDDPTNDRTGRVTHDNFLRSTDGIIASGHNKGTDFDTTPTDTTYDSYFWQNSNTEFQLIGNDIYYLDNSTATINKLTDSGTQAVVSGLEADWFIKTDAYHYWPGCYSILSSDGVNLFYSNSNTIHKYDISTGTSSVVWDLSSHQYEIYGFKWENCKLYCDMNDSPNFTATTKADNQISSVYHKEMLPSEKWIIDTFATETEIGSTHRDCTGCGEAITGTTTTQGISCITDTTGSASVDYKNKVIFLSEEMCNDISSLISDGTSASSSSDTSFSDFFGTGSTYNIEIGNEKVTFTVITDGDLNGDSVCDVLDSAAAAIYLSGKKTPTKEELYAANGEVAEEIDMAAYQSLVNKTVA